MKFPILPFGIGALLLVASSCTSVAPATQEKMVIAPRTVTFQAGQLSSTVSITHTCTCPFHWEATMRPADSAKLLLVLGKNFLATNSGDNLAIPVSIDSSKLTKALDTVTIFVNGHQYGSDSIVVIAMK